MNLLSLRLSIVGLLLAGVSLAQQPTTSPILPPPGAIPLMPDPVDKPAKSLGETQIVEPIIEEKLSGAALSGLYTRYTGRRVITTTEASAAEFAFVQEASKENPLTFAQAAELLRKAAVLSGFVFTQHPDDPSLDILTLATGGPRPTNVQVQVCNEKTGLPENDIVVTYVMTFNYIKPDQAVQVFTQVIGQIGAYGAILAVPNASAVVITEKASLIRTLLNLKDTIDVPGSVQATSFIKVEYADVTEIATILTDLLTAQQSAQQTAGVKRAPGGAAAAPSGAPATPESSSAGESTPVQIVAEPRTNRIFAMGRPVDLVFVEGLIRQFDIPADERTYFKQKLKFLTVSDFMPVAGDALTRAFSGSADSGAGATGGASQGQQQRSRQTSNSNANNSNSRNSRNSRNSSSGQNGFSGGMGGGGGGSGSGSSASLAESDVNSAPESLLVGRTLLVADNITNTIVAQGPPSALEIIKRLLEQIDVRPDQVMISAIIGQLTYTKDLELGLNYMLDGNDAIGAGGGSNTFPAFNPTALVGSGLQVYGKIGDLSAYLKALSKKTDFTVLSRPSIFTSNNQEGTISSGQRIAIPTEGGTNTGNFTSGTRIQYEDVVLELKVRPLVNSKDEITLNIGLGSDEVIDEQVIAGAGTSGGDLTVPLIATRNLSTIATVPNNGTIVLGGLIVGRNNMTTSGIPILSDIPYLGALFGSNSKNEDRTELMIFIQPSIINSDEALDANQKDMDFRYKVSDEVDEFAFADGNLFGVAEKAEAAKKAAASEQAPTGTETSTAPKSKMRPRHRR